MYVMVMIVMVAGGHGSECVIVMIVMFVGGHGSHSGS